MQNSLEENLRTMILNVIKDHIAPQTSGQGHIYHMTHEQGIALPDESAHFLQIFQADEYFYNKQEEKFIELDRKLGKELDRRFKELMEENGEWTLIKRGENQLGAIYQSLSEDTVHLHYADHSIHLHIFNSGQY